MQEKAFSSFCGEQHRRVQPPDAEDRTSGGVGGVTGAIPLPRPDPEIVQWFKTMTTNEYIRGVGTLGWSPFPGKLWQRNYYEHVIRDEVSLNRIREYIVNNPPQWEMDRENPDIRGWDVRAGLKPTPTGDEPWRT